jgi:hypothetical protein
MTACYTDRISARPGDSIALHASSAGGGACVLEIARVGARRRVVHRATVTVGDHPTPDEADARGCGWPAACAITVGADWDSGYYDIALADAAGETAHHFVCIRPAAQATRAKAVLVLATNTLFAYNYWGGANAYAHVESFMARKAGMAASIERAIGRLSTQRPIAPLLVAAPPDMPRSVNLRKRGFKERPWMGAEAPTWARTHKMSPYDGASGFLNKWEHAFAAWAEEAAIGLDYLTDYDLDADPQALDPYSCVIVAGHSEYWSGPQRDAIDAFVDRGGGLAVFSGNTCFWKVRWEDAGRTLVCHKWKGFEAEAVPSAEATQLWSHPAFARPEAETTGLSFLFGGYHRLGRCAARGIGGYTVYREGHWALDGCDLGYGDVFGDQVPLLGYENDGCPLRIGDDGLPAAASWLGVPEGLEIVALAPAAYGETPGDYGPLIPPDHLDVVAEIAYGDAGPQTQARVLRGHAVMASFRRGAGEVFNAGTTEWAHGLAAADPFVTRITRNVLKRFGAV